MNKARNYAINLLARRDHSRQELAEKIQRKLEIEESDLNQLLDELTESGYLNDQRYAEMLVRSSIARGHGPMKITYAMRNKGIEQTLAQTVLEEAQTDWLEQASSLRERKFGEEIPKDFKERARQSRFLAGRGFYIETINAIFQ